MNGAYIVYYMAAIPPVIVPAAAGGTILPQMLQQGLYAGSAR